MTEQLSLRQQADSASWQTVTSSNVFAVAFVDADDDADGVSTLFVKFKGDKVYAYYGITRSQFDDLLSAPSKGKWVDVHLKKANVDFDGPI